MTNPIFSTTRTIDYAGQAPNVMVRAGIPEKKGADPGFAYSTDYGHSWSPLAVPPLRGLNAQGQPEVKRYDLEGDLAIAVSADGKAIVVMTPVPLITRDFGRSWAPARGLPMWGRLVADRVNPNRFYAVDLTNLQMLASNDGGMTFAPVGKKLYANIIYKWATAPGDPWPLMATPGIEGDLWIKTGGNELYHSTDGGESLKFVDAKMSVDALGFGKPAPGKDYPTLFAYGWNSPVRQIFRSLDKGKSWQRIGDADHQYGWAYKCIAGDLRVFGRVYIGTDGRGIVYGEPEE
jgi:xyloglucan-specific exo-beta-1,4-glucanase